jgi:RNA polymerase-interacting CarD/CdnL/TRCF family regulator
LNLTHGDYLTSPQIAAGIFTGIDKIEVEDQLIPFYKIFDIAKKITHYIPEENLKYLQKLPSKKTYNQYLKIMEDLEYIDVQKLDGTRYQFFKHKINTGSIKSTFEAVHDLMLLEFKKEITVTERKLLNPNRNKLIDEISFVFEVQPKEAESIISLKTQVQG